MFIYASFLPHAMFLDAYEFQYHQKITVSLHLLVKRSFVSLATWLLHPAFVVYSLYFLGRPGCCCSTRERFGGLSVV